MAMRITLPAREFKTKCLKLIDEVQRHGVEIVITKRGRPVAMLAPVQEATADIIGSQKGTIRIDGDIVSPIGEQWDAER